MATMASQQLGNVRSTPDAENSIQGLSATVANWMPMQQMDPDFQSPFDPTQLSPSYDASDMEVLPNALRLSQSRARFAEESLRSIEQACRETWSVIVRREQECAQELSLAEAEYESLLRQLQDASRTRQSGDDEGTHDARALMDEHRELPGDAELHVDAGLQRSGGGNLMAMQPCSSMSVSSLEAFASQDVQRLHERRPPGQAQLVVLSGQFRESPDFPHSLVPEARRGREIGLQESRDRSLTPQVKHVQKRVQALRHQSFAISVARRAMDAHLGPCLSPAEKYRAPVSVELEPGPSSNFSEEPVWNEQADHVQAQQVPSRWGEPFAGGPESLGAYRRASMDESQLAALRQRVQVAERVALETMQRARHEAQARMVAQAAMGCCQERLQETTRKLEESQSHNESLRKDNKRLVRRLRHQARILGSQAEGSQELPCCEEGSGTILGSSNNRLSHLKAFFTVRSYLQLLSGVRTYLRRGVEFAWAFFTRLLLFPPMPLLSSSDVDPSSRVAGELQHDEGPKSNLAPSPRTAWESGPIWDVEEEDALLDRVWDEWEDDVEVIPRSSRSEEPWHTVLFIHVVFTWQEAVA